MYISFLSHASSGIANLMILEYINLTKFGENCINQMAHIMTTFLETVKLVTEGQANTLFLRQKRTGVAQNRRVIPVYYRAFCVPTLPGVSVRSYEGTSFPIFPCFPLNFHAIFPISPSSPKQNFRKFIPIVSIFSITLNSHQMALQIATR